VALPIKLTLTEAVGVHRAEQRRRIYKWERVIELTRKS
jgi:hypothetical protein